MATKANTITAPRAATPDFAGRNKAKRAAAFLQLAPQAYGLETMRQALIANATLVLGDSPDTLLIDHVRREVTIGIVAARLPVTERPKGCNDDGDKLEYARDLRCNYAAPVAEGATAKKLRAGQKGRRSAVQHKIVRAAEQMASTILADAGATGAKTTTDRVASAKAKRNATKAAQGAAKFGKDTAKPNASELVKAPIKTRADACQHVNAQSASLADFAKKNAKLLPASVGTAVNAFRTAMLKAMNDEQERLARLDAKKAETEK